MNNITKKYLINKSIVVLTIILFLILTWFFIYTDLYVYNGESKIANSLISIIFSLIIILVYGIGGYCLNPKKPTLGLGMVIYGFLLTLYTIFVNLFYFFLYPFVFLVLGKLGLDIRFLGAISNIIYSLLFYIVLFKGVLIDNLIINLAYDAIDKYNHKGKYCKMYNETKNLKIKVFTLVCISVPLFNPLFLPQLQKIGINLSDDISQGILNYQVYIYGLVLGCDTIIEMFKKEFKQFKLEHQSKNS